MIIIRNKTIWRIKDSDCKGVKTQGHNQNNFNSDNSNNKLNNQTKSKLKARFDMVD